MKVKPLIAVHDKLLKRLVVFVEWMTMEKRNNI